MTKRIDLTFQHPRERWDSFLGVKLDESSYDTLVEDSADVFTPEGHLLFRFRKNCLDPAAASEAYPVLAEIKQPSKNRGLANGRLLLREQKKGYTTKDGRISNTAQSILNKHLNAVGSSAVIGYMDRYPRMPYCRETAFNAQQADKFARVMPLLASVDSAYRWMDAERYALHRKIVDQTSKDFVISGTVFTTITVNQNWQTAVHTDQGDLKDGLSCILVLRSGDYVGGHLVFPHYRVAARLDTCDMLAFDSHHMHGNTPIIGKPGAFKRVSLVCYYRERMRDCGTAAEELERAKSRRRGDPLHVKIGSPRE